MTRHRCSRPGERYRHRPIDCRVHRIPPRHCATRRQHLLSRRREHHPSQVSVSGSTRRTSYSVLNVMTTLAELVLTRGANNHRCGAWRTEWPERRRVIKRTPHSAGWLPPGVTGIDGIRCVLNPVRHVIPSDQVQGALLKVQGARRRPLSRRLFDRLLERRAKP